MTQRSDATARTVLIHRTAVSGLVAALARAVPASLQLLWRGPIESISLADGVDGRPRRWSLRPVELLVPPEMVLQQRLTIPASARRDLSSAIELFIAHKTPFSPDELLVHASENSTRPDDEHASYIIRAVPRSAVEAALTNLRIDRRRIGQIRVAGLPDVDLGPALQPRVSVARWFFLAPVAITMISLGALVVDDLRSKSDRIALMQGEVSAALARVRTLSAELEALGQQQAGMIEVSRLLEATPSTYLVLGALRRQLPEGAEITKIERRGEATRLAIRSPDVLSVVQALNGATDVRWTASIDGPVTTDPASGREAATILLRRPNA